MVCHLAETMSVKTLMQNGMAASSVQHNVTQKNVTHTFRIGIKWHNWHNFEAVSLLKNSEIHSEYFISTHKFQKGNISRRAAEINLVTDVPYQYPMTLT